jgi:hypothetical protein
LTIKSFFLYFYCLRTSKHIIKQHCFNIIFDIFSIFIFIKNINKFRPTSTRFFVHLRKTSPTSNLPPHTLTSPSSTSLPQTPQLAIAKSSNKCGYDMGLLPGDQPRRTRVSTRRDHQRHQSSP